ncbi:MAG: hypothetical protein OEZ01_09300, partial [Candidatus Heimdallarchaeota archaeon]|nr:hypothetical protein [Candidatus Heimdallarchaeota archaeon]
ALLKVHLVLSYFDDIWGPKIIDTHPALELDGLPMKTITKLIDMNALDQLGEWTFIYSDPYFSSLTFKFPIPNKDSRGGFTDYSISIVVVPSQGAVLLPFSNQNELLYRIKHTCTESVIRYIESSNEDKIDNELFKALILVYDNIRLILENYLNKVFPTKYRFY